MTKYDVDAYKYIVRHIRISHDSFRLKSNQILEVGGIIVSHIGST